MTRMPSTVGMRTDRTAVLVSGGLDSCVMLVLLTRSARRVSPVYVRCGLVWEDEELERLDAFLEAVAHPRIDPVQVLDLPMEDVYGGLWHTSGAGIPGFHEPDERWEIPGRNLVLLVKAAVWCRLNSVGGIALGILGTNPFSDASAEFFDGLERTLSRGLDFSLHVLRPLGGMSKSEVIRLGQDLPLELTLSCAEPRKGVHCGVCGKCKERIEAFAESGIPDPTDYAAPPPV